MSTQQQPPAPQVFPSLAELDKKPEVQPQDSDPAEEKKGETDPNTPPADPNKLPVEGEKKPEEVQEGEETEENEEEQEEETNPQAFYDEVSKLRGDNFQFKFPEGVDPTTPAGVHHAFTQLLDYEFERFEQDLMRRDARAYAYMLHRDNGGNDEDFFATKTEVLPEWEVLKNSVDLQQAFYRRALARKEVSPKVIDVIIKDAIEKNELEAAVEGEYNRMKKLDEDQAKKLLQINQENEAKKTQMINAMGSLLKEKIIDNKGLGITIPDAKRGSFLQFVNQLVHLDPQTGQWYIQQALTNENINALLESMYYLSVGGNMNEIISNRAKAENTKQLRLNMGKDKKKTSTQPNPNKAEKPGVQPALSTL